MGDRQSEYSQLEGRIAHSQPPHTFLTFPAHQAFFLGLQQDWYSSLANLRLMGTKDNRHDALHDGLPRVPTYIDYNSYTQ